MVRGYLGYAAARFENVLSTRVLVLGGDGMLGRMLRLRFSGVPGLVLKWTSRREESGAIPFRAESPQSLVDIAGQHGGFHYVINCIAVLRAGATSSGPETETRMHEINALFPHELARIAAEIESKLIHISTDAVFAPESGVCFEADEAAPADFYGRTKLLGEPSAPNAITIRCSIIGPNPVNKTGLLEWVVGQPPKAMINGYSDQLWCGVTTLQFAELCLQIFQEGLFERLRGESRVHHFCPNEAVTKYQLLKLLCGRFRPDIAVEESAGGAIKRVLGTRGILGELCGAELPMDVAIHELSTYIDGPNAAGA